MPTNVKIIELPSGNFNAKVYDYTDANKKRHYKSITAPSKREVKKLIAEFLAQRETSKLYNPAMTVSGALDKYIESKSNILSPSTIRGYKKIRKNNFCGIMDADINKLTTEIIQSEINKEASQFSPKTVRNVYGLLSAALAMFLPEKKFHVQLPQKQKARIEIPTEEEIKQIISAVRGTELEIPIYLAVYSGMRASEICAMTWEDIDLKAKTAKVRRATVLDETGTYVVKGTKTIAGTRTVRLFEPVVKLLTKADKKTERLTNITPQSLSKRFGTMLRQNKIKHYRLHDMRHYTVSVLLSLNIPKKYIADFVGHESEHMIDSVYGHIMQGAKINFMDIADNYFANAT